MANSDVVAMFAAAGDPSTTRTVYAIVVALVVIGVALLGLAIWLIRQTKPELEVLAPLERMNDRSWRRQDPAEAQRELDRLRPAGARPVVRAKSVPSVDTQFAAGAPPLASFDDLDSDFEDDGSGQVRLIDPLLAVEHRSPVVHDDSIRRYDSDPDEFPSASDTAAIERPEPTR